MYPAVEYVVYVIEQAAPPQSMLPYAGIIISALSVLIAGLALFFSFKHIREERRYKILTTKPRIIFKLTNPTENDTALTLSIVNCGLGPAIIKKINTSLRNQPEPDSSIKDIATHITKNTFVKIHTNSLANEQHLAPNQDYPLIIVKGEFQTVLRVKGKLKKNCDVSITYESIYGETFTEKM